MLCLPRLFGRLYVKGVMMGFKRGLRNQYEHTSILKIENVKEKKDTDFYLGKRVCFIYKVSRAECSIRSACFGDKARARA